VLRQHTLHLEEDGLDPCEMDPFDVQNGEKDGTEQRLTLEPFSAGDLLQCRHGHQLYTDCRYSHLGESHISSRISIIGGARFARKAIVPFEEMSKVEVKNFKND